MGKLTAGVDCEREADAWQEVDPALDPYVPLYRVLRALLGYTFAKRASMT